MQKKGQITLFIIIGIVVLVVIALFFLIRVGSVSEREPESDIAIEVKGYIDSCLRNSLERAFDWYAVTIRSDDIAVFKSRIKEYIDGNYEHSINRCDLSPYDVIEAGAASSDVSVKHEGRVNSICFVSITTNYPVTITKGENTYKVEDFYAAYDFPNC